MDLTRICIRPFQKKYDPTVEKKSEPDLTIENTRIRNQAMHNIKQYIHIITKGLVTFLKLKFIRPKTNFDRAPKGGGDYGLTIYF